MVTETWLPSLRHEPVRFSALLAEKVVHYGRVCVVEPKGSDTNGLVTRRDPGQVPRGWSYVPRSLSRRQLAHRADMDRC